MNNDKSRLNYLRILSKFKHIVLCLIGALLLGLNASATTCTANANGDWDNDATWSCGHVPGCGDTIIIAANKTVSITNAQVDMSGCGPVTYIRVNGTLKFTNGFKLRLNCGSIIEVPSGGLITSTANGNGNNNLIEICSNVVWNSGCGSLPGPLSLPSYDCVLPITLISFTAEKSKDDVTLRWVTGSEINNDYFVIEKSANGKDFSELATVDGAGNSTTNLYYSLNDDRPYSPVSYYRLKQVDFDGTTTYSKIVAVRMSGKDFESLTMVSDHDNSAIRVTLVGSYKGKAEYHLSDALGNIIASSTVQTTEGINEIKIDATRLARSVYYFTIRNENEGLTKKIFY